MRLQRVGSHSDRGHLLCLGFCVNQALRPRVRPAAAREVCGGSERRVCDAPQRSARELAPRGTFWAGSPFGRVGAPGARWREAREVAGHSAAQHLRRPTTRQSRAKLLGRRGPETLPAVDVITRTLLWLMTVTGLLLHKWKCPEGS